MQKFKLIIGTLIAIFLDVRKKYEDGKLSAFEIISLTGWIDDIYQVISNLKGFREMYTALKPEEKKQLIQYFNEEFAIDDKKVEHLIEKIFAIFLNLNEAFAIITEKKPTDQLSAPSESQS